MSGYIMAHTITRFMRAKLYPYLAPEDQSSKSSILRLRAKARSSGLQGRFSVLLF
jgi:hypothetical protein